MSFGIVHGQQKFRAPEVLRRKKKWLNVMGAKNGFIEVMKRFLLICLKLKILSGIVNLVSKCNKQI